MGKLSPGLVAAHRRWLKKRKAIHKKIIKLWEQGSKSVCAIAKIVQCSDGTVRKVLYRNGVQFTWERRKPQKKAVKKKVQKNFRSNPIGHRKFWRSNLQILKGLLDGMGIREFARERELSHTAVSNAAAFIKDAGFQVASTMKPPVDRPNIFFKVAFAIYRSRKKDKGIAKQFSCDPAQVAELRQLMDELAIVRK